MYFLIDKNTFPADRCCYLEVWCTPGISSTQGLTTFVVIFPRAENQQRCRCGNNCSWYGRNPVGKFSFHLGQNPNWKWLAWKSFSRASKNSFLPQDKSKDLRRKVCPWASWILTKCWMFGKAHVCPDKVFLFSYGRQVQLTHRDTPSASTSRKPRPFPGIVAGETILLIFGACGSSEVVRWLQWLGEKDQASGTRKCNSMSQEISRFQICVSADTKAHTGPPSLIQLPAGFLPVSTSLVLFQCLEEFQLFGNKEIIQSTNCTLHRNFEIAKLALFSVSTWQRK